MTIDVEDALLGLVARGAVKVPPYPAVAMKLNQLVSSGHYGLHDLSKVIAQDPALAADVLRCANSSLYAHGAPVTSLSQAVTRIGAKEIARLALASGLASAAQGGGALHALKRETWQCSVAAALICQVLAAKRGLPTDEAFTCGLLHDFGAVIAVSALEELLKQQPGELACHEDEWRADVERVHVRLGLLVATRWRLPPVVSDVIAFHHEPTYRESPHARMIELAMASDAVIALLREHASVSSVELARAAHVLPAEREAVARALPDLPSLIASFAKATVAPPPLEAPPPQAAPEIALPEGFRPCELRVDQVRPKERGPYTMQGIGTRGFLMTGAKPMPQSALVEMRVAASPELTFWATVVSSTPRGDEQVITCDCFALNGPTLSRWHELYRNAPRPH